MARSTIRIPDMTKGTREDYYDKFFGRPRAFYDAEELLSLGKDYCAAWEGMRRPTSICGLCLFMGIREETFARYARGDYDHIDNFAEAAKQLKSFIRMDKIEKALVGIYHAGFTQYNLQHEHGIIPKTIVETITTPLDEDISLEDPEILKMELEKRGLPANIFQR